MILKQSMDYVASFLDAWVLAKNETTLYSKHGSGMFWIITTSLRRHCNARPDGIGHPLAEPDRSDVNHPPRRSQSRSTAPLGARSDCPAACLVGHQSDMVSLGLVQGCFKMYWGVYIGLVLGLV